MKHRLAIVLAIFIIQVNVSAEGMGKKAVDKAFNPPKAQKPKKNKEKVPLLINVGFSLSKYRLFDVYDTPTGQAERAPSIFAGEINLNAVVERKTVKKYEKKIPQKFRKLALSFHEISATHVYIPRTLYIQPRNSSDIEAYGVTWGFVPSVSFGWLKLGGGPIATYLHYRDFNEPDPVHFIRPGLRGVAALRIPIFSRRFVLEVGGKGDIYIPQKFYGNNSLWNIRGVYAQIHLRFPTIIEAKI